jgi:periplasmic divalent cation tolerance protein
MAQEQRGVIIVSTFPNEQSAAQVAFGVVDAKLCACVNLAKIRSIYSWKGRLEDQKECLALFKTTKKSAEKLKIEIARMHPYEAPEIIELGMGGVSRTYLEWMVAESSPKGVSKKRHYAAKRRNP